MSTTFNKRVTRLCSIALILCMVLMMPMTVFAADEEGAEGNPRMASVAAKFLPNDTAPQTSVTFNAYKVAEFQGGALFYWSPEYQAYQLEIPDMTDDAAVQNMNDTLAGYIQRDQLTADYTATTDNTGAFSFPEIDLGMYLVVGSNYETRDAIYTPVPFLVFFPHTTEVGGIGFNVEDLEVKYVKTDKEIPIVSEHVIKVWDDSGYSGRPDSISVDLLQDGALFETVSLSSSNNWRYTWDTLEGDHVYSIVESSTPGAYRTSVEQDGDTTVITNYYRPSTPPPSNNTSTRTPDPERPLVPISDPEVPTVRLEEGPDILAPMPDIPTPAATPETPENPEEPVNPPETVDIVEPPVPLEDKIPQTGQLWWPVFLLAGAGACCIVLGLWHPAKGKKVK